MKRKTPPPKPADAKPTPEPADPLLLPDDTPCIEGRWPDGSPRRMMKPADRAPPALSPPVTIADLRERIKRTQQHWIGSHAGDIGLQIFAHHEVADWWNDARMIPGAPVPPPMPAPFPGPSGEPQEGLRAADVMLDWLATVEAPPDGPWSQPDSPKRWAKVFGCSSTTIVRLFKVGKVRNRKLNDRKYQVHVGDLPAGYER